MTRENVRRGKSCTTKNLPADLKIDRTMGTTLCNKILADDLRKCTKRKELRNQEPASRPQKRSYYGNHIMQIHADGPRKCMKKESMGQVYLLEVDPPRQHFSHMQSKGWRGQSVPVRSRPHPDKVLATCRGEVKGV
ncbi:hypothetical protein PanWU01x14_301260 [Parasponia andersonii]|uniref:Uncharacterized protein n=1 Tax=Parasponia andersonii TaxID=3476 RepID=A0A2P5ATQ0_PARAD|nr:hypothetical protein PanWU01x14_301260 [Parasponia andersonii]